MKKCPYCGKEYPDEATVCTADGGDLASPVADRQNLTGVWRGAYAYAQRTKLTGVAPVGFTLNLKQGWFRRFTGSVTDDLPQGIPGTGTIDGYFSPPRIEFTKKMPVGYILFPDGVRMTLREHALTIGHPCEADLPAPPISYQGSFLDANRVQGTWIIHPRRITLPRGYALPMGRTAGYWCAEFATADTRMIPTGGPTTALFDKTLLSAEELEEVEGVIFRSLGKFNLPDANKFLKQFEQENIRFEITKDDTAIRQMNPLTASFGGYSGMAELMEISVHPDDIAYADAIIHQDDRI